LERAKNETEKLNAENEQREENIKAMTKDRDHLRVSILFVEFWCNNSGFLSHSY
jgi:SMC interacting uncharacterized protein involved in chromosome segregation